MKTGKFLSAGSLLIVLISMMTSTIMAQDTLFVRFRLIQVESAGKADSLKKRVQAGDEFQLLARKHSSHPSAGQGGDSGWLQFPPLNSQYADLLRGIDDYEISDILTRPDGRSFLLQRVAIRTQAEYLQWNVDLNELKARVSAVEALMRQNNIQMARHELAEAEKLYPEVQEVFYVYALLELKARQLEAEGQYDAAVTVYKRLSDQARSTGESRWLLDAYIGMGQNEHRAGHNVKAISRLDTALQMAQQMGDVAAEGIAAGSMAQATAAIGDYANALPHYIKALAISRSSGDTFFESIWLAGIAGAHQGRGHYNRAKAYYDSSRVISESIGNHHQRSMSIGGIGQCELALSNFEQAQKLFEAAEQISISLGKDRDAAIWLGNQAHVDRMTGEFRTSIDKYNRALKLSTQANDKHNTAVWIGGMGQSYYALGNYPRALENADSALAISHSLRDTENEAAWLGFSGQVQAALGHASEAINLFERALRVAQQRGDRRSEGVRRGNIGQIYFGLGNYEEAIKHYEEALRLARESGDQLNEGVRLGSLGQCYDALGNFAEALSQYEKALAIAVARGDRQNEGIWLGSAGQAERNQGNYAAAQTYFEQALDIAEDISDSESIWRHYWNIATVKSRQDSYSARDIKRDFEDALRALENITGELVKDVHKRAYLEDKQGLYDDYVAFLIKQDRSDFAERALEVSEASRTKALKDLLQGQKLLAPLSVEKRQDAINRMHELIASSATSGEIAQANTGDGNSFANLEDWATNIVIPPDTLGSSDGAPDIEMREIRAEAQNHTLVVYHVLLNGIASWVIKKDGEVFSQFQPIAYDSLFNLIRLTRDALGVAGAELRGGRAVGSAGRAPAYEPLLKQMHTLLITPLSDHLPTDPTEELVFMAHDILFLMPLACLQDEEGQYLVQRHTIVTSPSIGLLKFTRSRIREKQDQDTPRLLLVGNPNMPNPNLWSQLPGAETEVLSIKQRIAQLGSDAISETGASPLTVLDLVGPHASEFEVRQLASIQTYIHIATHGYLVSNPLRCGLVFGRTGNSIDRDGVLTTAEIFGLPLNADLVVLSACETGLGKISSDGVAGLSRAFLYAGTSSLIVSLWKVPDNATKDLMINFYESLALTGNRAEALKTAQAAAIEKYPHPRDWAAFTLIGQTE